MCIVRELYCDIFESAKNLHAQQSQKTHLKMSFVKYAALLQAHLSLFVIGQKLQTLSRSCENLYDNHLYVTV